MQRRGQRAFTMIEIALAIGVIGFALVAIIGILPAGLNVQKDNREDTIVSQDAPYFLNAIRNGEQRTNHNILAQYVESITISNLTDGGLTTYTNPSMPSLLVGTIGELTNDAAIIGLLSTPEYDPRLLDPAGVLITNQVTAIVRAMTGSATEQGGSNGAVAFRYAMTVEVVPWVGYGFEMTNYLAASDLIESNFLYNRWYESQFESQYMTNNIHEVRLKFSWPVLPNGNIGPNYQTYRSVVSAHLFMTNAAAPFYWYFQPNTYTTNTLSAGL
ncbi:MAG TPA: type II secretion system protein [Candidatus Saccharimonadales bacterium]|nr:type II secretion system protein [Candidatus Saccharimonadales bacterium]